jgi:site-specific DNA-cytosine methylase
MKNTIISLFDLTGTWSKPYRDNGYDVIQVDIQLGYDILKWDYKQVDKNSVYGILNASPCTDFAISGARHFAKKDSNGQTENSIKVARKGLEIIDYFKPEFWVLENPMTRIHKLIPEIGPVKFKFNPCDFAGYLPEDLQDTERYNKATWLFGNFNDPIKKRIDPLHKDSPIWKQNEHHKKPKGMSLQNWRSKTPEGFAIAFYEANNWGE